MILDYLNSLSDYLNSKKIKYFGPSYLDIINNELNNDLYKLSKSEIEKLINKGAKINDKYLRKISKNNDINAIDYVLSQYKNKIKLNVLSMSTLCSDERWNKYHKSIDEKYKNVEKLVDLFQDKLLPDEYTYNYCKTYNIDHNKKLINYITNNIPNYKKTETLQELCKHRNYKNDYIISSIKQYILSTKPDIDIYTYNSCVRDTNGELKDFLQNYIKKYN